MTTTDWRELCAELLDALNGWHQAVFETGPGWVRPDETYLIDRARAALAQPDPALSQRPECFEFALDFLGSPENDQLLEYIERLEARAALAQPVVEVAPGPPMEDVGPLTAWLTEQAHQAADASQPADAGMLTWAAQVIGERVDEDAPAPAPDPTDMQLLAQPVAGGVVLTDDQLDLLVIAIQALAPHQPDASSHDLAAVDQGREILRNALARWGSGQVILDNSAPAPAVEVTDLRRAADLLEQRHSTPVPVSERLPWASHVYFEFVVSDADYCPQAGGIAPTYAQALSEGQHYLAQYQQDGPHTLELRRVEVLNPDALPLPAEEVE